MSIEDAVEGSRVIAPPTEEPSTVSRVRYVVYPQLISLLPSIVVGRSEQWGHGAAWAVQAAAMILALPFVIFALVCPFLVLALFLAEYPGEKWSIWTIPLSIALSFVVLLALLPGFQ